MSAEHSGSVKVIQLVGESTESWEAAAQQALDDAGETLEGISGIEYHWPNGKSRRQRDSPVPLDGPHHVPNPTVRIERHNVN